MVIVLEAGRKSNNPFYDIIVVSTFVNLVLSLLINIFATSIIAVKAWKYRKTLMTSGVGIRTPTLAIKILALVVESGVLYIFIGVSPACLVHGHKHGSSRVFLSRQVAVLVSTFINLPSDSGTLSNIFGSVTVHLAVRNHF